MNNDRPPPPAQGQDDTDLNTTPLAEIERDERRTIFARHGSLCLAVAALGIALVVVGASTAYLVGKGRGGAEPVGIDDGRATEAAEEILQPVASHTVFATFFTGVLEEEGSRREALTLRFGSAQVDDSGWHRTEYLMNSPSWRERGVAILPPSATRLLLGSGESFEVGRNASGQLVLRGGEGRRIRFTSESP